MLFTVFALLFGNILAFAAVEVAAAPAGKVTVCHKPQTSAQHEITISRNALPAHLAHGDYEGECDPAPPPMECNQLNISGGEGTTITVHELGVVGPTSFQLTYDMIFQPDHLTVVYEGAIIYDTGGPVSGTGDVMVIVPAGTSSTVTVTVVGPEVGTLWSYTVFCP